MKQVIQDIVNMDKHIICIDYKIKSYEEVLFIGNEEDCKSYIKCHTFYYN